MAKRNATPNDGSLLREALKNAKMDVPPLPVSPNGVVAITEMLASDGQLEAAPDMGVVIFTLRGMNDRTKEMDTFTGVVAFAGAIDIVHKIREAAVRIPIDKR